MSIAYPVFSDAIRQSLGSIENDSFQIYPSVIVDDKDVYHDDYWVFNIFEEIDVLNLENAVLMTSNQMKKNSQYLSTTWMMINCLQYQKKSAWSLCLNSRTIRI